VDRGWTRISNIWRRELRAYSMRYPASYQGLVCRVQTFLIEQGDKNWTKPGGKPQCRVSRHPPCSRCIVSWEKASLEIRSHACVQVPDEEEVSQYDASSAAFWINTERRLCRNAIVRKGKRSRSASDRKLGAVRWMRILPPTHSSSAGFLPSASFDTPVSARRGTSRL
jgi:hypothetical protein